MKFSEFIDPFAPADGPPPQTLLAFWKWAIKGSEKTVFWTMAVISLVGIMEVAVGLIIGWLVDVSVDADPDTFFAENWLTLVGIVLFFIVLRPTLQGIGAALTGLAVGPNLLPLVLSRLHRHTIGQALSFFDDDFAGRISQKQMQTSRAITDVVLEFINVITFALTSILATAVLLGAIDFWLVAVLAGWLLIYVLVVRWFVPRVRVISKARAAARAVVTGQVVDTITNIATVKLFANAEHEDREALGAMGEFRERALDFGLLTMQFRVSLMVIAGLLPAVVLGSTLYLWTTGIATAGDIAMAGIITLRVMHMTGWVSFAALGVFGNIGEIEDGMHTLTPPHSITDAPEAAEPEMAQGAVAFEDVTFGYGREGAGALARFDLFVKPGEKVALVGRSGAGKTTAVSLLLRLYDVEQGRVTLDGHDIRDLTQDALRRQIAMVRQETAMFNRSAMDNILYGRPSASEREVVEAAKRAEAHEFILDLQDFRGRGGYEAYLGERGVKLSGGQRQRIALARAILKDAPVLVLDEATSALDSEVEAEIQDALVDVMQGKTVIAIAHRLSTIAQMDRIVVLDEGRIVEEGTHAELLKQDGLYARFWNRQSGGFIGLEAAE